MDCAKYCQHCGRIIILNTLDNFLDTMHFVYVAPHNHVSFHVLYFNSAVEWHMLDLQNLETDTWVCDKTPVWSSAELSYSNLQLCYVVLKSKFHIVTFFLSPPPPPPPLDINMGIRNYDRTGFATPQLQGLEIISIKGYQLLNVYFT